MAICTCPVGTAIPSVPNAGGCPSDFGQIQKIVFQRIFKSGTTKNEFIGGTESTANPIEVLTSWTALFSATDGSKMVITPFVEAPTSDGGDAITFGGGNETVGGATRTIGRNPVNMSFALRQIPQAIAKALKGLMCENLGVYLINGEGQVLANHPALYASEPVYQPIPIQNLFVGDLMLYGLDTPDSNSLSFSFLPNWSDDVEIVTTEFNPLTDLANAE